MFKLLTIQWTEKNIHFVNFKHYLHLNKQYTIEMRKLNKTKLDEYNENLCYDKFSQWFLTILIYIICFIILHFFRFKN